MAPYLSVYQKIGVALCAVLITDVVRRKKRSVWSKTWLQKRKCFTHLKLVKELNGDDYRNFMRMDEDCFMELLAMVRPFIEKKSTVMRESVSAEERLVVTLRYLATGRTLEDLKFSAAISPQLLSSIIPETCEAIYNTLKEYIKVMIFSNRSISE